MNTAISDKSINDKLNYVNNLHPSIPRDDDVYDYLGRNTSAQKRRQNKLPWIHVVRNNINMRGKEQKIKKINIEN